MKNQILLLVLSTFVIFNSFSQSTETDQQSKKEILKLDFLIGNWKGNGWMMGADRKRTEFEQTENIQFKLDSTAILIEGKGTADNIVIHNALAIITFNKADSNYSFQSYLQNGSSGQFKAELINNKLHWYPTENVRYIIWTDDNGKWQETGEYNREGNWFHFFEMTLDKIE